MGQFHIEKDIPATPEKIWVVLVNFEKIDDPDAIVEILEPGDPENNFEGLVRTIKIGKTIIKEKILTVKPMESIEYQLLSGAPVHDYFGTLFLYPGKEFTTIRWVVTFRANFPWPEWMIKSAAKKKIHKVLEEIAEKATRD